MPPSHPPAGHRHRPDGPRSGTDLLDRRTPRRCVPQGLRDPAGEPVSSVCRRLPRGCPSSRPGGVDRRQGSRRVRHRAARRPADVDCPELRSRPLSPTERSLPSRPVCWLLPPRPSALVPIRSSRPRRDCGRPAVRRLLQRRGRRAAERMHPRAVAAHHHLRVAPRGRRARVDADGDEGAHEALVLPGGGVPTPRRRAPPRRRPGGRHRRGARHR